MTEGIPVAKSPNPTVRRAGVVVGLALACGPLSVITQPGALAAASSFQVLPDADGVQRIELIGGSYFFKPERIRAQAGMPIELAVKAEPGFVPHRLVLENRAGKVFADMELSEKTRQVRLDLPAGEYVFHCPTRLLMFRSHRERGMEGRLEILP